MSAYVKHNIENNIATIEFFHPEQNSLPGTILSQLANTITKVGNLPEVKVIIIKSGGDRTFCAGASFLELISITDAATGKVFFSGFANVINAMRKCPKFIIGRIQGKTVGGGVGIAAATDYCMATKFAAIKLSELNSISSTISANLDFESMLKLSSLNVIILDSLVGKSIKTHQIKIIKTIRNVSKNLKNFFKISFKFFILNQFIF